MTAGLRSSFAHYRFRAFSLVELLLVIGIAAILIGLLLPAIVGARRQANFTVCAARMSQVCTALQNYATCWKGRLPLNVTAPSPMYWYDDDRIGAYLSAPLDLGGGLGGGALICPEDDGGKRSYSMNIFASSKIDAAAVKKLPEKAIWDGVSRSSQVMLLLESWSSAGLEVPGFMAPPTIGAFGASAGQRFGGGTGISPAVNEGRFGMQITELAFGRHPFGGSFRSSDLRPSAGARLNIGYADGHVAARRADELVDLVGGISTGDSLWSPNDDMSPSMPGSAVP